VIRLFNEFVIFKDRFIFDKLSTIFLKKIFFYFKDCKTILDFGCGTGKNSILLKKNFPQISLTMIGPDKGILNEILLMIKELGLESNIKIIGPISNQELFKYYQSHSVYLNTTSYESFGVALVEAAACGIPIVSTNVEFILVSDFTLALRSLERFSKRVYYGTFHYFGTCRWFVCCFQLFRQIFKIYGIWKRSAFIYASN
jgi:SAM-dependent methyltransferase